MSVSTIAAISTPLSVGGLAVIRISGENALGIADKIFKPFKSSSKKLPSEMDGYTCAYGRVVCDGQTLDDVVLTVFKAPHSYTGLDTVEISCHGGVYLARKILRLVFDSGAVPAEAGEFTKLAFLNGKLGLTQAEAVMDILGAEGDAALKSARLIKEGGMYKKIKSVSNSLVKLLGSLAAWADYPDEDIPKTDGKTVLETMKKAAADIGQILNDYDAGRVLREGIDTAIVGRPNVGKSTLMNALLGYDRSIVTTAAGTTRDVIEETVRLGDVKLKLCDTAGMRDTSDEVEAIGVERAKKKLEDAQLVIAVLDGSQPLTDTDRELLQTLQGRRRIVVVNKSDLPQVNDLAYSDDENILYVSANTGEGLERITQRVNELFKLGQVSDGTHMFANERQRRLCMRAREFLDRAIDALEAGETIDAVTVCIDEATNALLQLSGEKVTEAVVDDVFSRFCVGK